MENNRSLIIIGVIGIAIVGMLVLLLHKPSQLDVLQASISSPYDGITITGAPNGTGGGAAPSATATGQYIIHGIDQLSLPDAVKSSLGENLGAALNTVITPTSFQSFIQIDTSTIKCADQYDCGFDFYVDSPEGYFAYHQFYTSSGSQAYTIERLPLAGAKS